MTLVSIKNIYSIKSSKSKFAYVILAILGFSGAFAQDAYLQQPEGTRQASRAGLIGQIEDLADPFVQSNVWVERNQGRIVFYRPRIGAMAATANGTNTSSTPNQRAGTNWQQLGAAAGTAYDVYDATKGGARSSASQVVSATRALARGNAYGQTRNTSDSVATQDSAQGDTNIDFELDANQPGAASVFVNGGYQASLVPGGYSQVCVAPGQLSLGVRYADIGVRPGDTARMDAISQLVLNGGATQYIKVQEGRGRMVLVPVNQQQALNELEGTRLQMHTVSRVKGQMACQMVSKPATESVTLSGDTLFKFDRADRAGLTDQGVQALELLVQNIRDRYQMVEHIHLLGYTDPFGSDAYNQRLSRERAATVSDYLQMSPMLRGRISTEGRGATELVVDNCGRTLTQQNKDCNLPNRRVVVQVTGVRN